MHKHVAIVKSHLEANSGLEIRRTLHFASKLFVPIFPCDLGYPSAIFYNLFDHRVSVGVKEAYYQQREGDGKKDIYKEGRRE
jgi:hypothetical protein